MKKVVIVPRCIEEIIVYKDKETEEALSHTNYKFDENGECELVMEFYDGVAYDVNGTGLMLTYPSQEKVQKHTILQNCIVNYTGIDDGFIYQRDIALRYGKLVWCPDNDKAWYKSYNKQEFNTFAETLITLSGDIYEKVYSVVGYYTETARIIRELAIKFENWWNENADDDTDFILALEDFEEKELEALGYQGLTEEDFDEDPEWDDDPDDDPEWDDEPDDEPEGAPDDYIALIKKAADDITKASLQIAAQFAK